MLIRLLFVIDFLGWLDPVTEENMPRRGREGYGVEDVIYSETERVGLEALV